VPQLIAVGWTCMRRWSDRGAGTMTLWMYPQVSGPPWAGPAAELHGWLLRRPRASPRLAAIPAKGD
jgi:hypothetical protein